MRKDKPSSSALMLAQSLAYLGRDARVAPLFPRGAAERTLALSV